MHFFKFITISLVFPYLASAQQHACDGNRYIDNVFTNVIEHSSIQYGEAITLNGATLQLFMDIYEPEGDTLSQRPVLIMAHGGAFVSGNRSEFKEFCEEFARKGFVTATISYRLIDALIFDSVGIAKAVIMASNDMRAAVRFFKEDAAMANVYKANPELIFVGGASAGGVAASQVAFLDEEDSLSPYVQTIVDDEGGIEGNSSDNTQFSSSVSGVLNYSGSLIRDFWIDENDPPLYSAHDDLDPVVPCGYGNSIAFPFEAYTYGSCSMEAVANQVGITNQLYLVENSSGHVSYFGNSEIFTVVQESAEFLESIICNQVTSTHQTEISSFDVNVFPNPNDGHFFVALNNTEPFEIEVLDVLGRTLVRKKVNGGKSEISLEAVQTSGPLLLSVKQGPKSIVKKIIVE